MGTSILKNGDKVKDGSNNNMIKKSDKIAGLSILEAIVSTAVVGIGFIAILQMTNFSVQSINSSGDRTKANYLSEMIVEDVIGSRNTFFQQSSNNEDIMYNPMYNEARLNGTPLTSFVEHFSDTDNHWNPDTTQTKFNCEATAASTTSNNLQTTQNVYETQRTDAVRNKLDKWNSIIGENRFLKCKSNQEQKKLAIFEICKWADTCPNILESITDDPLYIGRVEMRINDGKKRKFVYFQADYKLRRWPPNPEDAEQGEQNQNNQN